MKKSFAYIWLLSIVLFFVQCGPDDAPTVSDVVIDIDGNTYGTIKLGNQIWTTENLKVTTFNDGTPITEWTLVNDWFSFSVPIPYFQWADTNDLNNLFDEELPEDFYGAMYNETALRSGKLAPEGWRIPTEQDFKILEAFLTNNGHANKEATVLKSFSGWSSSSGNGSDIYGFNGLPNGYVAVGGTATGVPTIATWATADVNSVENTRRVVNLFNEDNILYVSNSILLGAGVRLIKE